MVLQAEKSQKYRPIDTFLTSDDRRWLINDSQLEVTQDNFSSFSAFCPKSGHTSPLKPTIVLLRNIHLNRIIRVRVKRRMTGVRWLITYVFCKRQ